MAHKKRKKVTIITTDQLQAQGNGKKEATKGENATKNANKCITRGNNQPSDQQQPKCRKVDENNYSTQEKEMKRN